MHLERDLFIPPWLFDTIVRIEEQPSDRILIIPVGGVRNLGKTTAIIQLLRHLASKQKPNKDGVRHLRIGVLREVYSDFEQIMESFEEWFPLQKYDAVLRRQKLGFGYKDINRAPKIITYERTPDLLSLMLDGTQAWDGTYTQISFRGYSYNTPNADSRIRGKNLGSGWVNEAQTLPEKPISTLMGSINRPDGDIVNSVLLVDFNLPEWKEKGYKFLKNLVALDGGKYAAIDDSDGIDVYFPKMPAPYYFEEDVDGSFEFDGRIGRLVENKDFLAQAPHLSDLSNYAQFMILSDDEKRRNLLGQFGRKNEGKLIYTEFGDRHIKTVPAPNIAEHKDKLILMPIDFGYNPGVLFGYVEHGTIKIFKEFAIENINFYELLTTYIIPYCEKHLGGFYNIADGAEQDRVVPIGDPMSGSRRDAIKSAQPANVLLGKTDINGDEDGDAERFHFIKTTPSPCGNVIDHRINVSKQMLSKPHGVIIDPSCTVLIEALSDEYVASADGNPKKSSNTLYHNVVDAFQYFCAYLYAGLPTEYVRRKKRKRRKRRRKGRR